MGRWEFHTAGHLELYALANLLYPVELQQQLQVPGNKTLDSAHHRLGDKKD
jgi:galactitol-specific phosphotransferase system IIC component